MTGKTETQYQHLEPRPGSNYRTLFLKGRRIRAAVVDAVVNGPDPAHRRRISLRSIRSRWRRSSRRSTMWPRIARSLSKSGTTKRPGSAPEVSWGPRGNEVPDRREHEQPGPRFKAPRSRA